jgi:hypothetical protein
MDPIQMLRQLRCTTTPPTITSLIKEFCATISSAQPEYVPVVPEGKVGYCYPNVKAKVEAEGGEIVYGRTIWVGEAFLDAEWHCVWRRNGKLIDVTAKEDGEEQILFLPTDEVWDGTTVWSNKRKLLTNDPIICEIVRAQEEVERHARRLPNGNLQYNFAPMLKKLEKRLTRPQGPHKVGRNGPCPCGSGRKYKKCCLNKRDK